MECGDRPDFFVWNSRKCPRFCDCPEGNQSAGAVGYGLFMAAQLEKVNVACEACQRRGDRAPKGMGCRLLIESALLIFMFSSSSFTRNQLLASGHLQHGFRKAGSFELQTGGSFMDRLQVGLDSPNCEGVARIT
jgi:hypothetical protein